MVDDVKKGGWLNVSKALPYLLKRVSGTISTSWRGFIDVKKRRAQICTQIQRFIKIPTELRRQTRTSTTHTKHKRSACSRKPNSTGSLTCQEDCFTLDSHMLTSDSFFSLPTQHDQSQGNTNTTNKETKQNKTNGKKRGTCSLCRSVLCQVM